MNNPSNLTGYQKHKASARLTDKVANWIVIAIGSTASVVIHGVWFYLWFVYKLDVNLLTNIVSLEAIFLGIFVLIQTRMQTSRDEVQSLHDHENMERMRQLLEELAQKADINVG
jgi:hypothetical protein